MVRAVAHAHTILSWQENLVEDEVPPEWMWALDEELEDWFEAVKDAREERRGGGGEDREVVPMLQNEMTRR